jgi:hypothetical protein
VRLTGKGQAMQPKVAGHCGPGTLLIALSSHAPCNSSALRDPVYLLEALVSEYRPLVQQVVAWLLLHRAVGLLQAASPAIQQVYMAVWLRHLLQYRAAQGASCTLLGISHTAARTQMVHWLGYGEVKGMPG